MVGPSERLVNPNLHCVIPAKRNQNPPLPTQIPVKKRRPSGRFVIVNHKREAADRVSRCTWPTASLRHSRRPRCTCPRRGARLCRPDSSPCRTPRAAPPTSRNSAVNAPSSVAWYNAARRAPNHNSGDISLIHFAWFVWSETHTELHISRRFVLSSWTCSATTARTQDRTRHKPTFLRNKQCSARLNVSGDYGAHKGQQHAGILHTSRRHRLADLLPSDHAQRSKQR